MAALWVWRLELGSSERASIWQLSISPAQYQFIEGKIPQELHTQYRQCCVFFLFVFCFLKFVLHNSSPPSLVGILHSFIFLDLLLQRLRSCANVDGKSPQGLNPTQRTTENYWEWEKKSFPGKRTPIGYPIPNGQPWEHVHTGDSRQIEQIIFMNLWTYTHTYMYVTTMKTRPWISKRARKGLWEGLERGKGI